MDTLNYQLKETDSLNRTRMLDTLEYSSKFFEFMDYVNANKHVCNISTITLICNLDVNELDLKMIVDSLQDSIFDVF